MAEPRILALETSGSTGSVAAAQGETLLAEELLCSAARHAADLLPAIDRLCARLGWTARDIAQCHVSIGPGSFTGLRIAVTFARHLALTTGVRLVAVPTLDVIAEEARDEVEPGGHVAVLLDAKRGQVFGALYRREANAMISLGGPTLIEPAALLSGAPRPCWVTGEGVAHHASAVEASGLPCVSPEQRWPRARSACRLGWRRAMAGDFTPAESLTPLYVRIPEAEEIWARRQA